MENKNLDSETSRFKKVDKDKCDRLMTEKLDRAFSKVESSRSLLHEITAEDGRITTIHRDVACVIIADMNKAIDSFRHECETLGLSHIMVESYLLGLDEYYEDDYEED